MRALPMWIGLLAGSLALPAGAEVPASYRLGVERFASHMLSKYGIDEGEVLAQAQYRQAIIDAMRRPYEAKPWHAYRPIFLTEKRIRSGLAFWRKNQEILERAEATYGVPPQIVTAIIGVETNYGSNLGKHRVIDALSTLSFTYPERADFFTAELEQFLLLARDESIDASTVTGSYAGAVGLPQFIPSSYRAYAVDFDRDGRRDLWGSTADAIGSVGNYFKRHGWAGGQPVAFKARLDGGIPDGVEVVGKKPGKPATRFGSLQAAGIRIDGHLSAATPVTLIRLDAPEPEYWLGLSNFYAITRYNHSNLYAMAVYQLSREILAAYGEQSTTRATENGSNHKGK